MKKYYDFLIDIPEFKIKKGDVCYRENGKYLMESSNRELPSYLKMDSNVISAHPYDRMFENGTFVIPNGQVLPSKYPSGLYVITDFYVRQNKYAIQSINDNSKTASVSVKNFKVAEIYFFIDSKGKIQMTYTGKDKDADEWRKISFNMFKKKEDAQKYRDSVISAWCGL